MADLPAKKSDDPRDYLTPQQIRAAELCAIGQPTTQIAQDPEVKVTDRTVRRWREERQFAKLVREIQASVLNDSHRIRGQSLTMVEQRFQEMIRDEWADMSIDQRIKVYDTLVKHSPRPPEMSVRKTLNQTVNQTVEWKTGGATVISDDGEVTEIGGRVLDVAVDDEDEEEI